MDKGIRPAARAKFIELNEKRRIGEAPYTGPKANTMFRKDILFFLVEQFGISIASAASHYNDAFKHVKEVTPELVEGLGRPPEKNNGGRKPKQPAPATQVGTLISQGIKPNTSVQTVTTNPSAEEVPETQTVFKVCKKSDGTVVAEGLSFEDAKALVEKAAAAKKAKLYFV
jgi:hypothetical protein